jgi:aryl-alcohol dehydrogenase-like predicted oxidoreductase
MRQSNQTRLGKDVFEKLLRDSYDRGVRFFDMADMYGTHSFVADALSKYPRDSYALQSKIWFRAGALPEKERPDADVCVERFLKELKTDYLDMVLIHCQTDKDWTDKMRKQMDILAKLKEKGLIRAHGASILSFAALEAAAAEPWVDTLNVRINAYGANMDDKDVNKVAEVVKKAHAAGKGIVAMKLIGEGKFRDDEEKRNESAKFVLNSKAADTLAIGFEKIEEVDDYTARVKKTPRD